MSRTRTGPQLAADQTASVGKQVDQICPRILVVIPGNLTDTNLEQSISGLGYEVVGIVNSGTEAICLAEQARPDVAVIDLTLQGTPDAISVAHEIKARFQISVLFLTTGTERETLARAGESAGDSSVRKPVREDELGAAVTAALNQQRLIREMFAEHSWLRKVLQSISDAVIATDRSGRVRYLNSRAEEMSGWTLNEAVGQAIEEIFPLETLQNERVEFCQLRKALAHKTAMSKKRFFLHSRTGATYAIEDAAAPIEEQERMIGAVTIFRDISDLLAEEGALGQQRERLEEKVHEMGAAFGQTRSQLRKLSGYLIGAREREKLQLSRELHDDFGQRAALLGLQIENLAATLPEDPRLLGTLEAMRNQIAGLSEGLRELSHSLFPSVLWDLGIVPGLRMLIEDFQNAGGSISFRWKEPSREVSIEIATALYRIAEEALRNSAKFGDGAPVRVTLTEGEDQLQMSIEDTGPGFNLEPTRSAGGLGLLNMQERARMIGGSLLVRTASGQGTQVLVRVPFGS